MTWRGRLHLLHRDAGYLCAGLVVVYAVSGIAVNHRHHWDYDRSIEEARTEVGTAAELLSDVAGTETDPGRLARSHRDLLVERVLRAIERTDTPHKVMWRNPQRLTMLFGEGDTDTVDFLPAKGLVEHTIMTERPILRQFNFLHLNEPRTVWTWFADVFAVLLLFLAVSGLLMVRGRRGLRGRGGILLAAGVLVPLVAILVLR